MAAMIEKLEQTEGRDRGNGASGAELKRRLVEHFDVLKRPNDLVRVTQVTSHHFRVNTLSPRMAEHAVMPVYRIVKSQFLHAQEQNGELVITDQTRY
jgi:hypothetical protein